MRSYRRFQLLALTPGDGWVLMRGRQERAAPSIGDAHETYLRRAMHHTLLVAPSKQRCEVCQSERVEVDMPETRILVPVSERCKRRLHVMSGLQPLVKASLTVLRDETVVSLQTESHWHFCRRTLARDDMHPAGPTKPKPSYHQHQTSRPGAHSGCTIIITEF